MRLYAIGDIHGHLDLARAAHDRIDRDRDLTGDYDAPVIHIGDYCDRGPNVAGLLDYLIAGQAAGAPWHFMKGNHDRMMRRFLEPERKRDQLRDDLHWLQDNMGGKTTLASYGVDVSPRRDRAAIHADAREAVSEHHITFLEGLQNSLHLGDVFLCHAGIRPGLPLDRQDEDDLVWIRDAFLMDMRDHGALIVHGHTPIRQVTHYGNRVNIDSGAAYGGPLTAIVIEGNAVWHLTDDGREILEPIPQIMAG
ncbi:metallophosphoesterase [Actibacterium sp. 188UL27-1]|uniref:metallophosphoesterase n=1 Tax=Actibacterium sp. 188UL27-1 TaxID=2786961 RepID=UPI001957CA8D|nr:metallophosphoesterase [Actibacterium sp. 188UL27-1]MBM7070105.1 metallophosphoesterase [Actibacterium sp. 188UL27-1]